MPHSHPRRVRAELTTAALAVATLAIGASCESKPTRSEPAPAGQPEQPGRAGPPAPQTVRDDLRDSFRRAGVAGGFALLDVDRGRRVVVDQRRATRRQVPASTFKVPHSLIALETGVVKDENEVIPYGGGPQRLAAWERDMSMREAIKISNVAIYRTLARRIGQRREKQWLDRLGYGGRQVGTKIGSFWLDGPLKISATEQADFMGRLARHRLPAAARHQRTVRDMVKVEVKDGYALFAKTGWADSTMPGVGWWAGWVERGGRAHAFALTIDIVNAADADKRIPLARDLLHRLGVLPGR